MDCLFCKFISGELKESKVFEDEDFIVIRDIAPKAKNHFLAIPKAHYAQLFELTADNAVILGKILAKIPTLEKELELDGGYRLIINQGDNAGQTVQHLHVHILSGQKMDWNPS